MFCYRVNVKTIYNSNIIYIRSVYWMLNERSAVL